MKVRSWLQLSDCSGVRRNVYGCLFSILAIRGQRWGDDVESSAEVERGVVGGLGRCVGPEVQRVAGLAALEAMEQVLVEVDAERAAGAAGGSVQGTRAALLSAVRAAGPEAEQFEYGVDGDGGSDGGEVDGGGFAGRIRLGVACLPRVASSLAGKCADDDATSYAPRRLGFDCSLISTGISFLSR